MKARASYLSLCDGMFSEPRRWRQGAPASRSVSRNHRAIQKGFPDVRWMRQDPDLDNLHDDVDKLLFNESGSGLKDGRQDPRDSYTTTRSCTMTASSQLLAARWSSAGGRGKRTRIYGVLLRGSPPPMSKLLVQRNRPQAGTPVQKHEGRRAPRFEDLFSYVFSDQLRSLDLAKGAVRFQGFCTAQKVDRSESYQSVGAWLVLQPLDRGRFSASLKLNTENNKAARIRTPSWPSTFRCCSMASPSS